MNNLFFFTGEHQQELEEKLNFWKKEFVKKHSDINLEVFDEVNQDSIATIINAFESAPFLGEKRMVIVRGFPFAADVKKNVETEALEEALKQLPETTLAIFVSAKPDKRSRFFKLLSAAAKIEAFQIPQGRDLSVWIQKRFQRHQQQISSRSADMLAFYCGGNLNTLGQEIEKLSLLGLPQIEEGTIEKFVTPHPEAKIFKVLDMVGKVPPAQLLRSFEELVNSGEDLMMIFYMIVRQIRLLVQVKYLQEKRTPQGLLQKRLKLAPFQVAVLSKQTDSFSLETLRRAYAALGELEYGLKTGRVPLASGQEHLLLTKIDQFLYSLYE